jgi:signal transduction histidine kinase
MLKKKDNRCYNCLQLENKLDQQTRNIGKIQNLKDIFITNASHELRTPLAIIKGNLDLLSVDRVNMPEIKKVISIVKEEISRLSRIVSDLTTTVYTNSEELMGYLEYSRIDLVSLIKKSASYFDVLAKRKKIKISVSGDSELMVWVDKRKVQSMIENLISNSIKYGRIDGYVKIDVQRKQDRVNIEIQDDGEGIGQKDIPHIFERFYRADSTEEGLGVGLFIVKSVTEAHGGSISVSIPKEGGTLFNITLPVDRRKQEGGP